MASGACAHRVVVPPTPAARAPQASFDGLDLYLNPFAIEGMNLRDGDEEIRALEVSFATLLEDQVQFGLVHLGETIPTAPEFPALQLDVRMTLNNTTYHTVVLDLLNLYPLLAGFVVPVWGHASLEMTMEVKRADGSAVQRFHTTLNDDYSNIFWSWYRNDYVENSFRRLYREAFDAMARELIAAGPVLFVAAGADPDDAVVAHHSPLPTPLTEPRQTPPNTPTEAALPALPPTAGMAAEPPPKTTEPAVAGSPQPLPARPTRAAAASHWRDAPTPPPPRPFGMIYEPLGSGPTTPLGAIATALGGIEAAAFVGIARVSSTANTATGDNLEVAAGDATQKGKRLSLYKAPETTGFFWYPTVGYLNQQISISDFRHTLPLVEIPGAVPLDVRCSNPASGTALDCGTPNAYRLDIESGYAGARAGVDAVTGNQTVQLFLSLNAGLNVVEYRNINARIGSYEATGKSWDWLRSGAFGATAGIRFPKAHLAARLIYDWEWYREIEYAEPLSFEGPVSANTVIVNGQTVAIPQEERVEVDAASLTSSCFQFALALTF